MISTILLSGGVGLRSGKNMPKQYIELFGKRIINYCLDSLLDANLNHELILVYGDGFLELLKEIMESYAGKFETVKFILGGETRQLSVYNGLLSATCETVILHESARPLITVEDLNNVVNHPSDSVTMGLDIPFTVLKQRNGEVVEILEREELFNVQLPQKFKTSDILKAHRTAMDENRTFTDDSSLLFAYNGKVSVIRGSHENVKITTPEDFTIAEKILLSRESRQES